MLLGAEGAREGERRDGRAGRVGVAQLEARGLGGRAGEGAAELLQVGEVGAFEAVAVGVCRRRKVHGADLADGRVAVVHGVESEGGLVRVRRGPWAARQRGAVSRVVDVGTMGLGWQSRAW